MTQESPETTQAQASHRGFYRTGGLFILMMFAGNVFEIAFTALTAHLPGSGYETFNALFNIFFILAAPLAGVQLMVSKEVSAFIALDETGKVRAFVLRTLQFVMVGALWLAAVGVMLSPKISEFLKIPTLAPVMLLMGVYLCYAPFPVFYGTVQGMKRFITIGFLQFAWGVARFGAALLAIRMLAGDVNTMLTATLGAMALSSLVAFIPAARVFRIPREPVRASEYVRAYSMVIPIILSTSMVMILKNTDIILAKRFFDSAGAQAYTCAARVGSGFFVLTGIIMVMFPHVSEEKTLGRNPIVFLVKSLSFTLGLSAAGLLIAGFAPSLVMKLITLGKTIPGAPPLIRYIGFAVLPLAMTYIMTNYLLAKHYAGFIPILAAGVLAQVMILWMAQESPVQLLTGLGIANTVVFLSMLLYVVLEHRRYMRDRSGKVEPI